MVDCSARIYRKSLFNIAFLQISQIARSIRPGRRDSPARTTCRRSLQSSRSRCGPVICSSEETYGTCAEASKRAGPVVSRSFGTTPSQTRSRTWSRLQIGIIGLRFSDLASRLPRNAFKPCRREAQTGSRSGPCSRGAGFVCRKYHGPFSSSASIVWTGPANVQKPSLDLQRLPGRQVDRALASQQDREGPGFPLFCGGAPPSCGQQRKRVGHCRDA